MSNRVAVGAQGTMLALRAQGRDSSEKLIYEQVPLPSPAIGDVLLEVHAASFTPTELDWPSTWVDRAGNARPTPIPAHEVSGTVIALGFGTTGFAVGDEVYGLTDWYRDGAAAGYVAVEARNLARKPGSLDHARSAAVPLAALSAWQALFDHAHLSAGQSVLIHGAGGGVVVPATERSGDRDPQKRISKEGDEMLRKLLVSGAHYVLGPFGSDSDLRRHGEKIASRGGKGSGQEAIRALASVVGYSGGLRSAPKRPSAPRAGGGSLGTERRWSRRAKRR